MKGLPKGGRLLASPFRCVGRRRGPRRKRLRVTQGQGGGKGGLVYPDPQTSPVVYHPFTMQ